MLDDEFVMPEAMVSGTLGAAIRSSDDRAVSRLSLTQDVVDLPQQRIKRRPTHCGGGAGPTIRTKPCPNFPFRLYLEVVHQFQDNRSTRAFTDGVPRTQDPGRPRIVALESTGRSA
jgi:hypothetical protein